jgi:tRNA(Ile)-lysidine synthase
MLLDAVRSTVERYSMIGCGDRVVVAVSGGADSMSLLFALHALSSDLHCALAVAHLDHGLRPSSAADARFVEEQAASLGLPVMSERCDVRGEAAARRQGIEEAARGVRRAFLARVAAEWGASRIALGHTADDQAETVLFRLTRGTGWDGLCGMAPVSGPIIRPLLFLTRGEVRQFAADQELPWREDETNCDVSFARNRIRERVLPELAAINPDVVRSLARFADIAGDMREVERYVVDRLWGDVCKSEGSGSLRLARTCVVALPPSVQSVVLREAMRRARGDLRGLGRSHVAAARRLAGGEAERGELHLPRLRLLVSRASIDFLTAGRRPPAGPWLVPLSLGRTTLATSGLSVEISLVARDEIATTPTGNPWEEVADADAVRFPLVARGRRDGDRFAPLGMGRDVRLKSFLINARVPVVERDHLALVCDQEKIVWVAGVRLSDRVKLRDSTQRVLVMRAEEVNE